MDDSDIIEVFNFWRSIGLKSVPANVDAPGWVRVLSELGEGLLSYAADEMVRQSVKDRDGNWRGRRFAPTAPELRTFALDLEGSSRNTEVRQTKRGCMRCGELLDEEGGILEHGSGFRILIQHCHPTMGGLVLWDEKPYRISGPRIILCDCNKGRLIAAQQSSASVDTNDHVWTPTPTMEQALKAFGRPDARLFITGSDPRLVTDDRRKGSPFSCRPRPEEELGKTAQAQQDRQLAYDVIRGKGDPVARFRQATGGHRAFRITEAKKRWSAA